MQGELHIFDKKKWSNKSFITKLAFRLLFKKVLLAEDVWMYGRCLDCDANNDNHEILDCNTFYCPCKFNEHLKLK